MIRSRAPIVWRVALAIGSSALLGACGSGGPPLAPPSTVAATTSTTRLPAVTTSTTGVRTVPTTGLYVPPPGVTSPTVARATTTTVAWTGPPSTMAQLLDGLSRSLASVEGVLHLTKVTTWEGSISATTSSEAWIDGARRLARTTWSAGSDQRATVVRDGVQYQWPAGIPLRVAMELPACLGVPSIVRVVVDCPTGQLVQPATVERGTVDGHDAVTFVSRQIIEPREVDLRESFDAITLLPIRTDQVSTPGGDPFRSTTTWAFDVVATATLADDFFTPEAIGVVFPTAEQLLAAVPVGTPVYWLGESSAGTLAGTLVVTGVEWSGIVAMLSYDVSDRRYAMPPALRVDTSSGEANGSVVNGVPACPGAPPPPIGAATVAVRCPGSPDGRVVVELTFADAVVRLESPYRCDGDVCTPGPLNDVDTLLALARALVRR